MPGCMVREKEKEKEKEESINQQSFVLEEEKKKDLEVTYKQATHPIQGKGNEQKSLIAEINRCAASTLAPNQSNPCHCQQWSGGGGKVAEEL